MPAQEAGGEPVECAHLDWLRPDEGRDAPPHLVGGLVREGQGDDLASRDALCDEVGDAAGDHTRLPAAGAGQHEQGAIHVGGCLPLGIVEVGKGRECHGSGASMPAGKV